MKTDKTISRQAYDLTGLYFLGGFLLYVGFFYPGFMTHDSAIQILQAREGTYSDWHPPAMAYLWGVVENIAIPGPAGMLILQSALIWGGAFLTYTAYFRNHGGAIAAMLLSLMLFFPPIFGIAGVIWKDIMMWGLLFLAFGIAGHIRPLGGRCALQAGLITCLVFMVLFAAILVRYNAVFAAIPLVALVFSRLVSHTTLPRLAISLLAGGMLSTIGSIGAGLISEQLSDHKTHAWVALSVFDTAGVIVRLEDREEQEYLYNQIPKIMRNAETVDAVLQTYSARYWRTLFVYKPIALRDPPSNMSTNLDFLGVIGFSALNTTELEQLQQLWLSLIRDYPLEWIKHRLAVSSHVLGLSPDRLWSPTMMNTNNFSEDLQAHYGRNPEPTTLQKVVELQIMSLTRLGLFRPWFYLALASAIMVISLRYFRPQHTEIILLSMSGVLYELGLLLVAPSPDFRYSHYLIFTATLSFLLLVRPGLARLSHKM